LGVSLSVDHGFPAISFNDWRLKNQIFDTEKRCFVEAIGDDGSRMSEEAYSLSHAFSKSASPTLMDQTFLPISVETSQNESQVRYSSKMHSSTHDYSTLTTKKIYDSLLRYLSQNSNNKEINFRQLVSPDEADTLQASTTFFNLLMLASSNQISLTQTSFDSPLLITLVRV
jgi:chromatin segregation and condensation protein Rec8/ScpA/Scc1 (kleisin family)